MGLGMSWLDFKLGFRMLVKHPGLALIGGLGMAVAIAISAGSFAFFYSHLYPTLPLEEGERLVALENWDTRANNEERRSLHDFVTWREELRSVQDVGAFRTVGRNLIVPGGPAEPLPVAEMSAAGFRAARVPPLLGRYLVEEDERVGAPPVLVIGYDVWRIRFASDPAVVGREVRLGSTVHMVVGVMPEGFAFPMSHRIWRPLRVDPSAYERGKGPEIFVFGRLAPGATFDQARAELATIGRRTSAAFPRTHEHLRPRVLPYTYPLLDIQDVGLWQVSVMQALVSLLLVVVAINVAVLVYARTATRQGEIAVRSALGASRRRIVGQLFTEGLVLSGVAAAVGLVLAQVGLRQGNQIMEQETGGAPFWVDYGLSPATLLYTAGLAVLAAVIVGVLPALTATGRRLQDSLSQLGGGTGMRMGRTWTVLIVAQVAIAVAALPAALAMGWKEIRHATTRPAFAAEEFLAAWLVMDRELPPGADAEAYAQEADARYASFHAELTRRLEAEPGVAGVTFASSVPGEEPEAHIEVEGVPAPAESAAGHPVGINRVDVGFFDAFDVRVLAGRGFGAGDLGAAATPVIVNRTFVEKVLGGGSALGRRIRYTGYAAGFEAVGGEEPEAGDPSRWYEVVGVVSDLHANAMATELVEAKLYHPAAPGHSGGVALAVRVRGTAPESFAGRLREITTALDPSLRLVGVRSLDALERQSKLAMRLMALVVGLVTLSVLLLSAAGIYALMSFTVAQRRKEIGIRSALGADPGRLLGSIFSRAAGQLALGLGVGAGMALLLEGLTGGELMDGKGAVLLPAVSTLMLAVGLLAAFGPARRGLRIQPTEALRADG